MAKSNAFFRDRRVAIIGATGGLGAALSRKLAGIGARLVLLGRNVEALEELSAELGCDQLTIDIEDLNSFQDVVHSIGEVNHVVFATGIDIRKGVERHNIAEIERLFAINSIGPIALSRAFLASLAPGGSINHLGGFGDGRLALPYYAVDVASRAALAAFVEAANRERALCGDDRYFAYLCPEPALTKAERPYAALWQQMGSNPVSPSLVSDFVVASIAVGSRRSIMGRTTAAISLVNAISPWLADLIALNSIGQALHKAFHKID